MANAIATVNDYFKKHRSQIAAALPRHLNPDRMARLALTEMSKNPKLAQCDPKTIFGSVIVSSQLGLEIGVAGQAYLVPYGRTCTLVPGWQGYVDLVSRTGRGTVWTGAVFKGDEFEYSMGTNPRIDHRPSGETDADLLTHVYAVGRVNGSDWPIIDVWPIERVWKHRDKNNKVGKAHYSYKHPEMYARKLPLLQVIKYMPKSIEIQQVQQVDLAASEGMASDFIDGEFVVQEESGADELNAAASAPEKPRQKASAKKDDPDGHQDFVDAMGEP